MPSRRSILTGSLAGSILLAGCSAITGPSGTAVAIQGASPDIPRSKSTSIVARSESGDRDRNGCPGGVINTRARLHEVSSRIGPKQLILVTEHRVIPGTNQCSSKWKQAYVEVRHNWKPADNGSITGWQSSVVPTNGDREREATLEETHTTEVSKWTLHLTPPTSNTNQYVFASTFTTSDAVKSNDTLVETRTEVTMTKGWFSGEKLRETESFLQY